MLLRCCMIQVTVRVKRVTLYAKSISMRIREYANAHRVGRLQFIYSWQLAAFFLVNPQHVTNLYLVVVGQIVHLIQTF